MMVSVIIEIFLSATEKNMIPFISMSWISMIRVHNFQIFVIRFIQPDDLELSLGCSNEEQDTVINAEQQRISYQHYTSYN